MSFIDTHQLSGNAAVWIYRDKMHPIRGTNAHSTSVQTVQVYRAIQLLFRFTSNKHVKNANLQALRHMWQHM